MSEDSKQSDATEKPATRDGLSPIQVLGSALAAAFGVQSSNNRDRDFSRGKPLQFILAGIVITAIFVICIIAVVQWVVAGDTA
jgi:hypothetical protein